MASNNNPPRRRPLREREVETDDMKPSPFSMAAIRGGFGQGLFMKIVLAALIFIFAAGFLFTGLMSRMENPNASGGGRGGGSSIATIGDETIDRANFDNAAQQQENQMVQFGQPTGPAEYFLLRRQALQQFITQAATLNAARAAGVTATPQEVDARIEKEIDDAIAQQKQAGEANFRRDLESQGLTEAAYRDQLKTRVPRDAVEKQIILDKFEKSIKDQVKVSAADYQKSQTRLDVRQIVIRPKLPDAKSKDAAAARAEKLAAQLKAAPASTRAALFSQLAKTDSDDTFSKSKGGALGVKLPSELQLSPPLRDALTNSTSDLIGPLQDETTGDFYLFDVVSRKFSPPADYAKKKAELLKAYQAQRADDAWNTLQQKIARDAKIEINDPSLKAFDLLTTEASKPGADLNALKTQAIALYEQALPAVGGAQANAIRYQLSQLYAASNQPAKQIEMLQKVVEDDGSVAMRLELARALASQKKTADAITQLQTASKDLTENPPQPSMFGGNPADAQHQQIAQEFSQLGRADLAAAELKKVKPAAPRGLGGMKGLPPGVQIMPGGGAR